MNKLFKDKPIDGNAIFQDIKARRSLTGSSGFIRNRSTGETVSVDSSIRGEDTQQAPIEPTPQQRGRDTSHDNDLMAADEGYKRYADTFEYRTGAIPSYEQYQRESQEPQEPQEQVSQEELETTKVDYMNTLGSMSNFMEEKGISYDYIMDRLPEEISEDTLEKLKDARKIETFDDMVNVGMVIDYMADILNLDTNKFFSTGETVECGDECQEERRIFEERQRQ